MQGRVETVNTSRGGVPKMPVFEAVIAAEGVGGDVQTDLTHHGGPDRAVTLFSLDVIRQLQSEGHTVTPGSTGENLTVSGLDWPAIVPGVRLAIGEGVEIEITRYTTPCFKLSAQFRNGDFTRMSQKANPGFSRVCAKVLKAGTVRPGDEVRVVRC